jgi:hypothetical protein
MSSNLPPGVTAGDLPGFNDFEVERFLACEAPALVVRHDSVIDCLNRLNEHFDERDIDTIKDTFETYMSPTMLSDQAADALCSWDGEVDATVSRGMVKVVCPSCGNETEYPYEPEDGEAA